MGCEHREERCVGFLSPGVSVAVLVLASTPLKASLSFQKSQKGNYGVYSLAHSSMIVQQRYVELSMVCSLLEAANPRVPKFIRSRVQLRAPSRCWHGTDKWS